MAGATPDLVPLLVAAVRAACAPEFNLNGIATTTGPSTPMLIVNGPAGRATGVNAGRGALGHGWRANAMLGRTLRLLITNVGGALPGTVSKSIMGQPGRFSFCFAENEPESPWAPLHADLNEAMNNLRRMIGEQDYTLDVTLVDESAIDIAVSARYAACEECLVPKEMMRSIADDCLSGTGYRLRTLTYPGEERAGEPPWRFVATATAHEA
jgi:hypothetical protein